ncbi:MAG: carbohydrate binding family 9 domain-containing protein [candidate division Zixibacteria bacterium]|nr:carbohydrate binding family 9 domain-containing protein [candidate division Zixibacteria bacterium]
MRVNLIVIALSTLLLLCSFSSAETIEGTRVVPEVSATKVNPHPPKIDGFLDDVIWQKSDIEIVRDFTQRTPNEGEIASESTHVAIVYDDEAIYFGIWLYDSEPEDIQKQLVRRDRYGEADRVAVRLDPFHDHQSGFGFEVNASGVQIDYTIFNDNNLDHSWDGVWTADVQMQPWGWSAEIKIPYHCLRFPKKDVHVWGMDFARWIGRKNESDRWAFVPASQGGFTSNFGHLTDIEGIKPAKHLEILPYAVSSFKTDNKSQGNPDGRDYFKNTGVDIKYGVSSNLTLDVTVNPDFGQVELDRPVLNLSAFETYFSEKRPFFVEGSDIFNTRYDLFYSRRIGRTPRVRINKYYDPDYDYSTDVPKASSIVSAAKLTGKLSSGMSIGILNAVTAEEKEKYVAKIMVIDSTELLHDTTYIYDDREGIVEPQANYSVVRVKQDVFKNSYIGAMMTVASQDTDHPATTGGIDWRLQTNNNKWGARGQVVFSRVDNENTGFGFSGEFEKQSGEHVRGSIYWGIKDENLKLNKLGFNSTNGIRNFGSWIQYQTREPWWVFRRTWNNFNSYFTWTYDGYNTTKGANYNFNAELMNYWNIGGGIGIQADVWDAWETRGNGMWLWPDNPTYNSWFDISSDSRKKLSFNINPGYGIDREGNWWANYVGISYRPASNVELSVGTNVSRTFGATRFVSNSVFYEVNGSDSVAYIKSVFGTLDKDEISPRFTANITFKRNLSLQFSARTVIAGLAYRDFRKYHGNKDYELLDPATEQRVIDELNANRNYNYSAINSTMILRWEYLPGSTIYLVWTRSRGERDYSVNDLEVNRDLKRLFSGGANNVFLIKASYWWNT